MEFRKGSELTIILNLEDILGNPLRVKDTAGFKLYVWTANKNNFLVFGKRDIKMKGNADRVVIPDYFMDTLESGVVCYTYDYSICDAALKCNDLVYTNVKEVVTDLYWRNSNFNEIPANPVNYRTLEYIRDLIEKEGLIRAKEICEIKEEIGNINLDDYYTKEETYNKEEIDDMLSVATDGGIISITTEGDDHLTLETSLDGSSVTITGSVDLSDYATTEDIENKQDILTAGTNITIEDNVISATGGISEVTATGDDILTLEASIEDSNLNISGSVNLEGYLTEEKAEETYQPIGNYAEKSDLDDYLTVENAASTYQPIGDYATKDDLDGYATEEWVKEQGYLTEHQDLSDYALKSEIPTKVSELDNDAEYITSAALDDYATTSSVNNSISSLETEIATKQDTLTAGDNITILNNTISATVPTKTSDLTNDSGFITDSALDNYYTKSDTYSKDEVEERIAQIEAGEETALDNYLTKTEASETYQPIGDYATKEDIPTKVSAFENDANYLTSTVADNTYATKNEVDSSLEDYVTKEEAASTYQPVGDYIISTDITNVVYISQSDYDNLTDPDSKTLYLTPEED